MSPGLLDGSRIEIDKIEPAAPGDLVVVFLDPKVVQRGHHTSRIKRLVASDPQGMLIVEMDNPPIQVFWPRSWVRAVHKVIRIVDDQEPRGSRITQADLLARYAADLAVRRGETRPC